jgi:hypothetical protein
MKTTKCPRGGGCGGTGWVWVPANDGPNPEPAHYVKCECNPRAAGEPEMVMAYERAENGDWVGAKDDVGYMDMGADDAPF